MVLIRIPNNMELFESKALSERVGDGIRSRLLQDSIDDHLHRTMTKHKSFNDSTDGKEVSDENYNQAVITLRETIKELKRLK